MSTQHIPTAMPSDTELLNAMEAATLDGHGWACNSVQPWQVLLSDAQYLPFRIHHTVREALAAGLGLTKGE